MERLNANARMLQKLKQELQNMKREFYNTGATEGCDEEHIAAYDAGDISGGRDGVQAPLLTLMKHKLILRRAILRMLMLQPTISALRVTIRVLMNLPLVVNKQQLTVSISPLV